MKTIKQIMIVAGLAVMLVACSSDKSGAPEESSDAKEIASAAPADDGRGVGPVKNVSLDAAISADRVSKGKAIYEMKCQACHRLDDQRVVGPGWKGVTKTRKPEWIMNMIVNPDEMLQKDPEAIKLFETYLTKMPNQNVTEEEARNILEFMRQNDAQ